MAAKKKPVPKKPPVKDTTKFTSQKPKSNRTDSAGRSGMGATKKTLKEAKAAKPGMSKTEKMSWIVAPELMALGTVISKAETAARKALFGSKYAGDPQPIKKLKPKKLK